MTTTERLLDYIRSAYLDGSSAVELTAKTPLLELNIIDSFAIFDLVNFLANEMGVKVPVERIHPENFRTVEAIARLVEELGSSSRS